MAFVVQVSVLGSYASTVASAVQNRRVPSHDVDDAVDDRGGGIRASRRQRRHRDPGVGGGIVRLDDAQRPPDVAPADRVELAAHGDHGSALMRLRRRRLRRPGVGRRIVGAQEVVRLPMRARRARLRSPPTGPPGPGPTGAAISSSTTRFRGRRPPCCQAGSWSRRSRRPRRSCRRARRPRSTTGRCSWARGRTKRGPYTVGRRPRRRGRTRRRFPRSSTARTSYQKVAPPGRPVST